MFAAANNEAKPITDLQIERLLSLKGLQKAIFDKQGIPNHLIGKMGKIDPDKFDIDIKHFKNDFGVIYRMGINDSFTVKKIIEDNIGMRHVRVQQYINNKIVLGGELIFHTDAISHKIMSVSGKYLASSDKLPQYEKINKNEAIDKLLNIVRFNNQVAIQEPELVYMFGKDGKGVLAWAMTTELMVTSDRQKNKIFIDSITGEFLDLQPQFYNALNREIWDAQGVDTNVGNNLVISEGGGSLDPIAQNAYDYVGLAWNYFNNVHGFDSTVAAGGVIHATVHFGINSDRARWTGQYLVFGDGDSAEDNGTWVVSDVVAHELTHAVSLFLANLFPTNESGALGEGFSDIFSASADAYHNGITTDTWLFAEDTVTQNIPLDAFRYMANPTQDGVTVDYYPDLKTDPTAPAKNNHNNSGIASLAYYLLVNGGQHPRGVTSTTVSAIGVQKAEKIFFRALESYMTSTETYEDVRNDTAKAASDLYGANSNEIIQLCRAWDAVGVNGMGEGFCDINPNILTTLTVEYVGCSPQNSPRYLAIWYSPSVILEYDVDFKRNSLPWSSFYNGTGTSGIYTDEQFATSVLRARGKGIDNIYGDYDESYLGPKSCNGGPIF